jgi:hypothetical protein
MHYPRPKFQDPNVSFTKTKPMFSAVEVEIPRPDYPVSAAENFKRAANRNNPLWVPNPLLDMQYLITRGPLLGEQSGVKHLADLKDGERYIDWFGCDWTWVAEAGGPMLTPGTIFLEDIVDWEKSVKFPDIESFTWKAQIDDFMKNRYNPDKAMCINLGAGCTERIVAILGGYSESMLALAVEPEACRDFFEAFADFDIKVIDYMFDHMPVDMVTIHDDWGTERDTFFSEKMMEELVLEPTKRIVQHVKSKGGIFEMHTCGNVTRFVPYMIEMGIDLMQIQRRAVDIPAIKEKYGDKIGVSTQIDGSLQNPDMKGEELLEAIRRTIDIYAKGGGFYTTAGALADPKDTWDAIFEQYCYSREFYDKEQNR